MGASCEIAIFGHGIELAAVQAGEGGRRAVVGAARKASGAFEIAAGNFGGKLGPRQLHL
jgi:formylmethanofuran:tetrahydromethanopterin formyltransferase